jgi:hypothetical protein
MQLYTRNGRRCCLCEVRKKLIYITPEEQVRQALIRKLIEDHKVPSHMIEIEVPLSHQIKGARGRADVVVNYYDEKKDKLLPLIVVECKKPAVWLGNDAVKNQLIRYNQILNPLVCGIHNGEKQFWYMWDKSTKQIKPIEQLPDYKSILRKQGFKLIPDEEGYELFDINMEENELFECLAEWVKIGEDTPKYFSSFIANLDNLFTDVYSEMPIGTYDGFEIIEDGGMRNIEYGNASGGSWGAAYRYFSIKDSLGNNQIVSFAILPREKSEKTDTRSGSRGSTTLIVAFDDNENCHNSLQLCIDDCVTISNTKVKIWHDGKLTVGKKGARPRMEVVNFVRERYPELVVNNRIELGLLDNSRDFQFKNKDVLAFTTNLIKYVLCREKLREEIYEGKR